MVPNMPKTELSQDKIEALLQFLNAYQAAQQLNIAETTLIKSIQPGHQRGIYIVDDMAVEVNIDECYATPVIAVIRDGKQVQ
jgi:hypothetical protein